jgi:hypothetical protein
MRRLLIVHHTPSPAMQEMFEAVVAGAGNDEIAGVEASGESLSLSVVGLSPLVMAIWSEWAI